VEFHYDSGYEQEGSQMQKLGRQKDENIHEKEDFVINGARSEFIEAVEIGLQLYPNLEPVSPFIRPRKLNTIKVRMTAFNLMGNACLTQALLHRSLPTENVHIKLGTQHRIPRQYF
jgi:hypothetical protein